MSQRYKILLYGVVSALAVWLIAFGAYQIAASRTVTLDKIRAYAESVDLAKLSADERAKAIQKLADMLNRLSFEDRREARLARLWEKWFAQMTEDERAQFLEATLPTGFKQMIGAFEEMPSERRQRAINDAVRGLREAQTQMAKGGAPMPTNAVMLSEDLQKRAATLGLKTFYSESSAQTKAEMAPLLEELQRMMEGGRFMYGGGPRNR
jgi:hypothetical protein